MNMMIVIKMKRVKKYDNNATNSSNNRNSTVRVR